MFVGNLINKYFEWLIFWILLLFKFFRIEFVILIFCLGNNLIFNVWIFGCVFNFVNFISICWNVLLYFGCKWWGVVIIFVIFLFLVCFNSVIFFLIVLGLLFILINIWLWILIMIY